MHALPTDVWLRSVGLSPTKTIDIVGRAVLRVVPRNQKRNGRERKGSDQSSSGRVVLCRIE